MAATLFTASQDSRDVERAIVVNRATHLSLTRSGCLIFSVTDSGEVSTDNVV